MNDVMLSFKQIVELDGKLSLLVAAYINTQDIVWFLSRLGELCLKISTITKIEYSVVEEGLLEMCRTEYKLNFENL